MFLQRRENKSPVSLKTMLYFTLLWLNNTRKAEAVFPANYPTASVC